MSTEIAEVTEVSQAITAANPLDVSPEIFRSALARRGDNRKALMEWIRSSLVRGTDFGRIHVMSKSKCDKGNRCDNEYHFSKDCLFKPGAEKIAGMLGVTPTFPTLHKYEDAALAGVELKQIILRCHMVDASGRIVADGIGARSLDQDYGDINKSLKMCSKSAHIDATLRMAGLSEVFTQDLDQMALDGKLEEAAPSPRMDPKGDSLKVAGSAATEKAAKAMKEALALKVDGRVYSLHVDLNTDQDVYIAASARLTAAECAEWKKAVGRHKEAMTEPLPERPF